MENNMERNNPLKQFADKSPSFMEMINSDMGKIRATVSPDNNPYYGVTPRQFEQAISVEFITQDGNSVGVFFHEIRSPIKFNPSIGIDFKTATGLEITITGRNIRPIFEYLLEHRLTWIKEHGESFDTSEEGSIFIEKLTITDKAETE